MVEAGRGLSEVEMAELRAWEDTHLGGLVLGPDGEPFGTSDWPGWIPPIGAPPWREPSATDGPDDPDGPADNVDDVDPGPVPVPSPDNDGVPVDLLRPTLDHGTVSLGAAGLWTMLVSYYWSCEDDRTITELHEHRPDNVVETDELLAELSAAGMVTVSAEGVVSIDPDHLGVIGPPRA